MKIVRVYYETSEGIKNAKFIKTINGLIPVFFEAETFLDKSHKIIKEEEIELDKFYRKEL